LIICRAETSAGAYISRLEPTTCILIKTIYKVQNVGSYANICGLTNGNYIYTFGLSGSAALYIYKHATYTITILGIAENVAPTGNIVTVRFHGNNATDTIVPANVDYGTEAKLFDHSSTGGCRGTFINKNCFLRGM